MKTAARIEVSLPPVPVSGTEVQTKRPYQVVIVYDDFASGKHAVETCARLVSEFKDQIAVRVKVWSFAVLRNAAVNLTAACDATKAQMVMVATSSEDLPQAVKKWIGAWLMASGGSRGLLVALLNIGGVKEQSPAEAYLRFAAASKGMEFLLERTGKAGESGMFCPQ